MPSARVLVGLRHGDDEVDEQPQRERRRKKDCQGDQAAVVGQTAPVERRLLSEQSEDKRQFPGGLTLKSKGDPPALPGWQ